MRGLPPQRSTGRGVCWRARPRLSHPHSCFVPSSFLLFLAHTLSHASLNALLCLGHHRLPRLGLAMTTVSCPRGGCGVTSQRSTAGARGPGAASRTPCQSQRPFFFASPSLTACAPLHPQTRRGRVGAAKAAEPPSQSTRAKGKVTAWPAPSPTPSTVTEDGPAPALPPVNGAGPGRAQAQPAGGGQGEGPLGPRFLEALYAGQVPTPDDTPKIASLARRLKAVSFFGTF